MDRIPASASRRIRATSDLLPGWTCPICLTFNGEGKGPNSASTCRHCDLPKAHVTEDQGVGLSELGRAIRAERQFILAHLHAQRDHLLPNNPLLAAHYGILADEIERLPTKLRS